MNIKWTNVLAFITITVTVVSIATAMVLGVASTMNHLNTIIATQEQ